MPLHSSALLLPRRSKVIVTGVRPLVGSRRLFTLACLEPKPTQQKKLVSSSGVRRKRRRSTESVEKPRAMLRGNTRPLTEAEKQVLGSNVGLNPSRILDRSEVASLIEDVDGRKRKKMKKQACVTVRPKSRNTQNGNSQTALSESRCNHRRIALTSPLKTCIVNFTVSS